MHRDADHRHGFARAERDHHRRRIHAQSAYERTGSYRRVLPRFLVVVLVSLAIECLVATFQYVHDDPAMLMQAAFIAFAAAALLVSWGAFLRLSRSSSD